ncbi:MAG TPA: metallopeptidase TldD-related protein [Candidatus Omnitrophota bacterium]|nr:metallopeptidase TldD-related protein [Candidatus Omnitrophota bacterium]
MKTNRPSRVLEEFRHLSGRMFKIARALPLRISIRIKKGILARFANNGVHQNGFQDLFFYTLSLSTKYGTFFSEKNDISEEGIKDALKNLTKGIGLSYSKPNIRHCEEHGFENRNKYHKVHEYFPVDLAKAPELAARAIEQGLETVRKERASANGYYSVYERFFYLADSKGFLFHPATAVRYGITVTKGGGKGYFAFYHPNVEKLKVDSVVSEAVDLARRASQNEISLEPGTYECVFSPRAFLEFMEPLRSHFDLNLYQSGKSVLSGGLGKRLFSEAFTLREDITHPKQFGVPFDADGKPKRKVTLIERGVLKNMLSEGNATHGIRENPFDPENLAAERGSLSLNQIFSKMKRGIFINKVRYHTLVRETGLEVTGLTTAGSVYIEDGEIQGQLSHVRYHDSILAVLREVIAAYQEEILLKDGERGAALLPYFWIAKLHVV